MSTVWTHAPPGVASGDRAEDVASTEMYRRWVRAPGRTGGTVPTAEVGFTART